MQKFHYNISCVRIKVVLNLTAHDRIKCIQNMRNNSVLQVTKKWLLWIPVILLKYKIFIHLPYYKSENKLFYLFSCDLIKKQVAQRATIAHLTASPQNSLNSSLV